MWNFIKIPSYFGITNNIGDSTVLGVGYDNFKVTKPEKHFRIQTFFTWHFIISGSGTLEVDKMKFELGGGDMFFIPPNVKMRYYPNPADPWEYVWFSLNGNAAGRYGEDLPDRQPGGTRHPPLEGVSGQGHRHPLRGSAGGCEAAGLSGHPPRSRPAETGRGRCAAGYVGAQL